MTVLPPGSWVEVGKAPDEQRRGMSTPVRLALLALVVVPVVAERSHAAHIGGGWVIASLVCVGAVLAIWAVPARAWWMRALVALCAGALVVPYGGKGAGAWVVVTLVVGAWAILGRPPLPGVPAVTGPGWAPLLVLAAIAWLRGRNDQQSIVIAVPALAMVVVTSMAAWMGPRFDEAIARFSHAVGRVVTRVGFALLAIPLIVLPWVVHRVLRIDPLEQPRVEGSTWLPRSGEPVRAAQPWRRDASGLGLPMWSSVRRGFGAVVITCLCLALLVPLTSRVRDRVRTTPAPVANQNTDPDVVPAALRSDAWYPDYLEDISWLWQTSVAWDPLAPVRLRDVRTRNINIVDGARASWSPPACDCPRLVVWMYGGSTTFGLGQRDEHTTASALARRAWEDGIALDVVNRGVVGDTHWEEAQRLTWDLATLPEPDLIIFMDGINDAQSVDRLAGETRQPLSFVKADFWNNYLEAATNAPIDSRWAPAEGDGGDPPPGASTVTLPPIEANTPQDWAELISERFETARTISERAAGASGVPVEWFWQPSIEFRPEIDGEPPPSGRAFSRDIFDGVLERLDPEVHDLTRSLDGIDQPLYWDQYHTNETGARAVADAMYDDLRAQLAAIEKARG